MGYIALIEFPCYLKLLGAVIKVILSSPGLLQHLCTLLFLHLLFVLQICYFLILIFNLPVKEKRTQHVVQSRPAVSPSAGELDWGTGEPSSTTISFAGGHQSQTHPQALPSTANSASNPHFILRITINPNAEISEGKTLIIIWHKLLIKRCTCPLVTRNLFCSYTHVHIKHRHLISYFALGTTISNARKTGGSEGKTNET